MLESSSFVLKVMKGEMLNDFMIKQNKMLLFPEFVAFWSEFEKIWTHLLFGFARKLLIHKKVQIL
jgi:hypothetical protein